MTACIHVAFGEKIVNIEGYLICVDSRVSDALKREIVDV